MDTNAKLKTFAGQAREFSGMSGTDVRVLAFVSDEQHQRIRARDIAATLRICTAYAHSCVQKLTKRGLIALFSPDPDRIETGKHPGGQIYTLTPKAHKLFGALALALAGAASPAPGPNPAAESTGQPALIETGRPTLIETGRPAITWKAAISNDYSITRARRREDFHSDQISALLTRTCDRIAPQGSQMPGATVHPTPAQPRDAAAPPTRFPAAGGPSPRTFLRSAWRALRELVGVPAEPPKLLIAERPAVRLLARSIREKLEELAPAGGRTVTRNGTEIRWARRSKREWAAVFTDWIGDHSVSPDTIARWIRDGLTAERVAGIVDPFNWCLKYVPILEWIDAETAKIERKTAHKSDLQTYIKDSKAIELHDKEAKKAWEDSDFARERRAWIADFFAENPPVSAKSETTVAAPPAREVPSEQELSRRQALARIALAKFGAG